MAVGSRLDEKYLLQCFFIYFVHDVYKTLDVEMFSLDFASIYHINIVAGSYTVKETVQTVNLALNGSVGALPTLPTILQFSIAG